VRERNHKGWDVLDIRLGDLPPDDGQFRPEDVPVASNREQRQIGGAQKAEVGVPLAEGVTAEVDVYIPVAFVVVVNGGQEAVGDQRPLKVLRHLQHEGAAF